MFLIAAKFIENVMLNVNFHPVKTINQNINVISEHFILFYYLDYLY